jgi:class 3 adenylate cyclase
VLRPVDLLSQAVSQLERGKYIEVAGVHGVKELNQLMQAFNQMASSLRLREKEKETALTDLGEKATALEKERGRTEKLLLNVLPVAIADRLQKGEKVEAETFPEVTVFFADIVGFTKLATELGPRSVATLLNELFEIFDDLAEKHKLEKIKTIGDCYMAVAGVPDRSPTHAQQMADFSLEALAALKSQNKQMSRNLEIRIGMHSGTVAAGIIGRKKFAYDLWGDVVNITSRLEGTAEPMKIHVSESVHARLEDSYLFEERGEVELKNRGKLRTYYLVGKKAERS